MKRIPNRRSGRVYRKQAVYLVAEVEDSVVGFLKLKRSCSHRLIRFANQVQLQKIYVLPAFANSGIGSGLMRSAEAQIHGSPFVSAWLMVHEENRRAVAFYERFGYRVIGRDTHDFEDVRVPFCVMEKTYATELSNAADSR